MVPSIDKIIDAALKMTKTPGGKKLVSTGYYLYMWCH
jgi:hypothetical protein